MGFQLQSLTRRLFRFPIYWNYALWKLLGWSTFPKSIFCKNTNPHTIIRSDIASSRLKYSSVLWIINAILKVLFIGRLKKHYFHNNIIFILLLVSRYLKTILQHLIVLITATGVLKKVIKTVFFSLFCIVVILNLDNNF